MHESILHENLHKHGRDAHLIYIHTFGNIDSKLEVIAHQLFLHINIPFHEVQLFAQRHIQTARQVEVSSYQLSQVEQVIGIMLIRFQYFTIKHIKHEMWRNTVAHTS